MKDLLRHLTGGFSFEPADVVLPLSIQRVKDAVHYKSIEGVKVRPTIDGSVRYMAAIGYVNRPDLLRRAIDTIPQYRKKLLLIDNSPSRELSRMDWLPPDIEVFTPPVPFTFPQMMNYLIKVSLKRNCEVLITMHNDAEAYPGTPDSLLMIVEALQREGRKWGVVYTNNDYLVAFNTKAFRDVGSWDTTFPQYFSDTDYYWRMGVAGYEYVWSNLPVHHVGSSTVLSDTYRGALHHATFSLYEWFYIEKWGGTWMGNEKFEKPFNGVLPPRSPTGSEAKS